MNEYSFRFEDVDGTHGLRELRFPNDSAAFSYAALTACGTLVEVYQGERLVGTVDERGGGPVICGQDECRNPVHSESVSHLLAC